MHMLMTGLKEFLLPSPQLQFNLSTQFVENSNLFASQYEANNMINCPMDPTSHLNNTLNSHFGIIIYRQNNPEAIAS
ncbi:hypothetical protein GCM10009411_23310 [Shewanella litoralis]|uniref:Uncharacterized protein n=1 Tax=Shewanella litoralis TaxID=2282700 RepID=A0ABQ2REZ1_9GAMM|nr:hypothetical protein GCM10009411_23310 [Shewanella litoralis]